VRLSDALKDAAPRGLAEVLQMARKIGDLKIPVGNQAQGLSDRRRSEIAKIVNLRERAGKQDFLVKVPGLTASGRFVIRRLDRLLPLIERTIHSLLDALGADEFAS